MPRLLLLLPQLPQDPASGAARSMRTICEFLAAAGWSVRALATTNTEAAALPDITGFLRESGFSPKIRPPNRAVYKHDRPVLEFDDARGIHYQLLDTGDLGVIGWQESQSAQFNRLYQRELADHKVVVRVLECARHLLARVKRVEHGIVERHVAVLQVAHEAASPLAVVPVRRVGNVERVLAHDRVGALGVKTAEWSKDILDAFIAHDPNRIATQAAVFFGISVGFAGMFAGLLLMRALA